MIIVEGWVRLETPLDVERLRMAALELINATRSSEPGCLAYAYAIDLEDPTLMRIIERWEDEAALDAHFRTPHMARFAPALAGARILAASVKAYAGDLIRPLMER